MSYIYPKSSGQCLVLNQGDSFYYPFDWKNGFSEIRAGFFFSAGFSGNGLVNPAIQNPGISNIYMGFKNHDNNILPKASGSSFIGISNRPADSTINLFGNLASFGNDGSNGWGYFLLSDSTGASSYFTANQQHGIPLANTTGNSSFASFWGIDLIIKGNTFSGCAIYDNSFYTDFSTGRLSSLLDSPPAQSNGQTGFFTTGFANGNSLLQTPNCLYINWPFLNNSLRIHSCMVSQYA